MGYVYGRNRICVFSLAAFLTVWTALIFVMPVQATDEPVRVGYYENAIFQEGAREGAVKSGYAYEYYRKLSEYTGWTYEYIYGDFSELYQAFLNGEIDLLAGLAFKEERARLIGYPDEPMGHESYNLIKHDTDDEITADPASWEGKQIGVLDSAMVEALQKYLDEHHAQAEIVPFQDYPPLYEAFDAGETDMVVTEDDFIYEHDHAEFLCVFGATDYYLCVSRKRPELLEELNRAQTLLAAEEPYFLNSLSARYYSSGVSSRALTPAEKEWISTHDTIRIGYLLNYLPYSGEDSEGQVTGIVKDMIPEMLESLDIDNLPVSYAGYENYDQMLEDMVNGVTDIVFPIGGGLYFAEENGISQSAPVVTSSTELIYFEASSEPEPTASFAVNQNNSMQEYYIRTHFPEAEIIYYPSIDECLKAVASGKAQYTILNGLRVSDILRNSKYNKLYHHQLTQSDERCFGVKFGNDGLIRLLNRGISVVGTDFAQNQAGNYTDALYSYTFWDLAKNHLWLFGALVFGVAALTIILLVRDSRRSKAQVRDKEKDRQALEEKNRQLERSRNALKETDDIVANAGLGVWHIILEDGKEPRMRGNAMMMDLLGITGQKLTEEETYTYWHSRILKEEIPSVEEGVREMLEGKFSEHTYRWEHPEKGVIYVRSGGISRSIGINKNLLQGYHGDVTAIVQEDARRTQALAEALEAAEQANRAKTVFLNNMSHDIRTPMNAIVGFTALASTHIGNDELVRDYLSKISISSQHLLSLINDVLDMSRIESGKVTIEEMDVHLPDVIHDLRTIIQSNISSRQQNLFVDIHHVIHEDIITDKLRLNQILLNILSNAIKFTPSEGTISFCVAEKPCSIPGCASYVFSIKDNGIGMSEEFRKTIFEAFTREKTSTVSGIQGTGLGMAITKNIVDMMGGTISVDSAEGKGTEFIVELPFKISNTRTERARLEEIQGFRALVVDDDIDNCLSVCSMLRETGLHPDWTSHGKEAVIRAREALEQNDPFRVYLVDLMMPDMNGIETVRQLRRIIGKDDPIYVLTAYDWGHLEDEASDAGVTGFCSKPVFMSELQTILKQRFCPADPEAEPEEKVNFDGKRILLAEDNEMNQMIAVAILEGAGFTVELANDGLQAVEKVQTAEPGYYDVVLMDIQMPRMDGYEAASKIRALEDAGKAAIPIIAVTANAFEEDKKHALEAGMNGHLAKPYDVPKMMDTLKQILNDGV